MIRSLLFVPGNQEELFPKALNSESDGIILDLEDGVAPDTKDSARSAVRQFLDETAVVDTKICVRINALDSGGFEDIEIVAHDAVDWIMVPMAETPRETWQTANIIGYFEERHGVGAANLCVSIETARGISNANEIATAHETINAISFGLADYTVNANLEPSETRDEVLYQRSAIANAAALGETQAIDFATLETKDTDQVRSDAESARSMGYTGKVAIHPNQIEPIHDVFTPTAEEIERARNIVDKYDAARNPGVIEIDGEMVDKPVVENARQTLELAATIDR